MSERTSVAKGKEASAEAIILANFEGRLMNFMSCRSLMLVSALNEAKSASTDFAEGRAPEKRKWVVWGVLKSTDIRKFIKVFKKLIDKLCVIRVFDLM